jgi:uncharacterized protein (DUF305 family)
LQGAVPGGRILIVDEGPYTSGDLNFITAASRLHQAFIQISRIAEQRAAHPGLKLFAQQMVQENTERLDMLRASTRNAVSQNITLEAGHQDILNGVMATSGNEADRVYAQGMLPALEALHAIYQQEAANGSSSVLRQIANDFVDRLSNYIETLRELNARVR